MQKVLEILIDLQHVDIKIQQLEAEKGDLPQKVKSLSDDIEQTQHLLDEKNQLKKNIFSEKLALDNDVQLLQTKLKKYKVQLYQVKTNKEYDAITLEIETSEQAAEEKGFNSLELEEAISALNEEIKDIEEKLNVQREQLVQSKKELEAKLEKTQAEEDALRNKRQGLAAELSRPVLASYDRIRQGRGGVAVSKLIHGSCDACSSRVPPQRALEIRMMNKINLCEVCGRIVVWKPESADVLGDDLVQD